MAALLCNRQPKTARPTLPMPSARYDAYQYGMQQAQDFALSDEWKAVTR